MRFLMMNTKNSVILNIIIHEFEKALADPYIVHYMTCFYLDERPWMKNSKHPMTNEYLAVREKTPWKDAPLWDNVSKPMRKIYCSFCHMIPKQAAIRLSSLIYEWVLPAKHEYMKKKYAQNAQKEAV